MSSRDVSGRRGFGNRKQRRAQAAQSRPGYPRIDPAKNSSAMDAVQDEDRAWFAANVGRNFCLRPMAAVELAFFEQLSPPENYGPFAYTLVRQVAPGHRVRFPFKTHTLHRPEHHGDNACAALLAEIEHDHPEAARANKAQNDIAAALRAPRSNRGER
jgi:hypothetical protein